MTMDCEVAPSVDLQAVKPGSRINFTVEQGAFNNIDLVEVNGFRIENIVARWGQNYGVLSFTSTNGLYDHVTAYGNGDSGIYPGSTEKGCDVAPNAYGTCGARAGSVAAGRPAASARRRRSNGMRGGTPPPRRRMRLFARKGHGLATWA